GVFPLSLAAGGAGDATAPFPLGLTLRRLTVSGGRIDYQDTLLLPPYWPPFNAYLASTAPYTVSAGAVSGKSQVVLERSELDVDNSIVLSRLGLRRSSEDDLIGREIGIPLTLALALMKDYRGDIALDLPFGGDVAAPTFSMRSVVLQ